MSKIIFRDLDFGLLVPVVILSVLSLVTLFSLNPLFFNEQLILFLLSVFIFIFISQSNLDILKFFSKHIYIFSLVIFSVVLILGIESRGAVRWIELFGLRIQFSEILKPFLAIVLASHLSNIKYFNFKEFLQVFILLAPLFFLIYLQPDLGNAIIYALVVICALLFAGFPFRYFLFVSVPFALAIPFLFQFLHDYQKQRILTFVNSSSDPLGTSYNVIQSVIAVGSGMISGKGIGQGTQSGLRFLPERQTDFIFATISEQLGFIGVAIVLFCFGFILYKIMKYIINTQNKFHRNFLAIFFFVIAVQLFVNIGMNMGIMPIVGITLPFVSYGGSSLVSNFIFLGLLTSISKAYKDRETLSIR